MSPVSDAAMGGVWKLPLASSRRTSRCAIEWPDGTGHDEPSAFLARIAHKGIAHLEPAAIVATYRHEVITTNAKHRGNPGSRVPPHSGIVTPRRSDTSGVGKPSHKGEAQR